eukprot:SAG31_NODE_5348_length_2593_cov_2.070970_1_plen_112_part_00
MVGHQQRAVGDVAACWGDPSTFQHTHPRAEGLRRAVTGGPRAVALRGLLVKRPLDTVPVFVHEFWREIGRRKVDHLDFILIGVGDGTIFGIVDGYPAWNELQSGGRPSHIR